MPKREPVNALVGVIAGALAGLAIGFVLLPIVLLFPGDTILLGALVGGPLGYALGDDFFNRLRDRWSP